jgi:hypothetical protein
MGWDYVCGGEAGGCARELTARHPIRPQVETFLHRIEIHRIRP